jgi:hypothetical protein
MSGPAIPQRRASDADRDRAVRTLQGAAVEGRLSHDSFVRRIDLALRAREQRALADLVADLEPPHDLKAGLRSGLTLLTGNLGGKAPAHPALALPDRGRPVLVVGRSCDCDIVLSDPAVSRVHAVLMRYPGRWLILDRQSTNGTRVNGRRIWGATEVEPGDRVTFGPLTFRLTRHAAFRTESAH